MYAIRSYYELGHCLGLYHEHQRPDRDSYVKVFFENILSSEAEEFDKRDNPLYVESDFPYDYHSIMHYPEYAFSINGENVITSYSIHYTKLYELRFMQPAPTSLTISG